MRAIGGDEAAVVGRAVRRFCQQLTHCVFAAAHTKPDAEHFSVSVFGEQPTPEDALATIGDHFAFAASAQQAHALVLPELRTAEDIVELLRLLAAGERWAVTLPPHKDHPHTGDLLVGLWWRTPSGDRTSVMGLAPLGEMPVTRRAPHVCLVAWCGPHLNPHRKQKVAGEVGLVSMPPAAAHQDRAVFDVAWKATREGVAQASAYPIDRSTRPDIAFGLPARCAAAVRTFASGCDAEGRPDRLR